LAKKWIYVAGPYTNADPVENTRVAITIGNCIAGIGLVPIIPHLTLFWHLIEPHPADFWYEYTMELLKRCDAVFRIHGPSEGADREVEYAEDHEIPVFTELKDMVAWLYKEGYDAWRCATESPQGN
jgi:hypothetical protein